MNKLSLIFLYIIIFISCKDDYYYLDSTELNGTIIRSNDKVVTMLLKVEAEATCPSTIEIIIYKNIIKFDFDKRLDTIYRRDWYGEPLSIQVNTDSCLTGEPRVGIKLLELK